MEAVPVSSTIDDDATTVMTDDQDGVPLSTWSPPPTLAAAFMAQVGIDPDAWEESKRLGPSTTSVVRRWTSSSSGFGPIRRDPSLHAPFNKFAKENKPLFDFVLATLGSSLASAHAISHAAAFIEEFIKHLPTVLDGPN